MLAMAFATSSSAADAGFAQMRLRVPSDRALAIGEMHPPPATMAAPTTGRRKTMLRAVVNGECPKPRRIGSAGVAGWSGYAATVEHDRNGGERRG